jgi:squalene-associated FAD-dependent desaturase
VAVVGAGLAGIAAAVSLKNAGALVSIHERTRLLGGKATSYEVDGVEVDNGQHVVLACCTEFLDLADELGFAPCLRMQPVFDVIVLGRGGRRARLRTAPLPAPLHLLPSFLRYHPLRWRDKVRVARALLAARTRAHDGEDMDSWLRRHGQNDAARTAFWDPFLVPALNADLRDCAAEAGTFVVRTAFLASRGAARIGYATVPLERLARRAVARADSIETRSAVVHVDSDGSTVRLRTDSGAVREYDAAVLAVPPRRLAAMLDRPERFGLHGLAAFRTEPIVDVHLWYDTGGRRLLGDAGFAALLSSPVQWVFEKSPGYLCCSMSSAREHVSLPEARLVELCSAELCAVLPALRTLSLRRGAATRDSDATFVPSPGLVRPGPRTAYANVAIAGAWTDTGWPATMESAVRSGRAAARALAPALERWRGSGAPAKAAFALTDGSAAPAKAAFALTDGSGAPAKAALGSETPEPAPDPMRLRMDRPQRAPTAGSERHADG